MECWITLNFRGFMKEETITDSTPPFPNAERRKGERLDSRCKDIAFLRKSLPLLSPKRLIFIMAMSIFFAEAVIMLLLNFVPAMPIYFEAMLDAAALLVVLSPTFYLFYYRPLMTHYEDRSEIVEQLCHSEERLNLALSAVNDGLWDWNLLTSEVYVSDRSSDILGFMPDALGNHISALAERLHPGERKNVEKLLQEHFKGNSDYYSTEHRLKHKDGHYIWVMARGQVVERSDDNWALRMIGTFTDITSRKQAEEALRRSEEDIRTLSRTMMHRSEEEKKHLAQDLHDEFGQVLCAFQLGVEMLRDHNYGPPDQYGAQCERLLSLVERLEVDLRHMCDHLRPVILDDLGLVPALKWHLEQFSELNPQVETCFGGIEHKVYIPHEKEIAFYRICQESLNNISKYAQASRVEVELSLNEEHLLLSISDNGVGFSEDMVRRKPGGWGLGLLGMRERAAAVGGEMEIVSSHGHGTKITVILPIEKTREVSTELLPEEACA